MNAAFCCASLGIVPTVRHADYIGSWLEVLREDNRAIVRAASQARRPQTSSSPCLLGMTRGPPLQRAGGRVMRFRCSLSRPSRTPGFPASAMPGSAVVPE